MKKTIIQNILSSVFMFICMLIVFTPPVYAAHYHIYTHNKTVSATCTTGAYTQFKCRCGATKKIKLTKATGHSYKTEKKIATCTTNGYSKTYCTKCNSVKSNNTIKATGHSYKTEKKIATCTTNGYSKTYCTKCNSVKSNQTIKATGHNVVIDKAVAAGNFTTGLTEGSHCSKCNIVINKQNVIPATGGNVWDGKTYIKPTKIEGDYLLINSSAELAWILNNANTNGKSKLKLKSDMDMGNYTLSSFPNSVKGFNGNNHCIKNLKIKGDGLFGNSNGISISNLNLDNVTISSTGNVGILVGTIKGNTTIKNCKVTNSSAVTSKGYAGGFVGYIIRNTETDRSISIKVTLKGCSINKTKISGTLAEGEFVGALNGYDNKETLIFTNCSSNTKVNDYTSCYIANNQSSFLPAIDSKYNGFVGTQKYHRGVIKFDENRLMIKWDGKTSVTPLLANKKYDGKNVTEGSNKYVVYSPFDMAGIREKTSTPAAIYLNENIDMNGQGGDRKYNVPANFTKSKYTSSDDNNFKPFKTVAILDGNNKTIYNLAISQLEKETGAFILTASGTTVHKNINFNNCQTVSTHKNVKTDAKAYGAILIASATGSSYTMQNVSAINCRVFALQKVGTLAGGLVANSNNIKKCTVKNSYVENYKCNIAETFDSGKKQITSSRWVRVKADFYPHGEVGGMFGFVQNSTKISDCHVKGTTIYGYGQNDKDASISGSRLGIAAIKAAGYFLVPGRHVGSFIGDIRATGNIKITDCTVDSASKCTNRTDKHNNTYNYIGQAYFVKYVDPDGKTVSIDGIKLTLADCNEKTVR